MFQDLLKPLGNNNSGATDEIVDKDHYLYLFSATPVDFVDGQAIELAGGSFSVYNLKDFTSLLVAASGWTNLTFYFIKSDGTYTITTGTSFSPNPYNITDYDYMWLYLNAGARTLTFTRS